MNYIATCILIGVLAFFVFVARGCDSQAEITKACLATNRTTLECKSLIN